MTKTERVCARLREMGFDIPAGTRVQRLYPGPASGLPGEWSWMLVDPEDRPLDIGSELPMTLLLRVPLSRWATRKPFSDTSIIVVADRLSTKVVSR